LRCKGSSICLPPKHPTHLARVAEQIPCTAIGFRLSATTTTQFQKTKTRLGLQQQLHRQPFRLGHLGWRAWQKYPKPLQRNRSPLPHASGTEWQPATRQPWAPAKSGNTASARARSRSPHAYKNAPQAASGNNRWPRASRVSATQPSPVLPRVRRGKLPLSTGWLRPMPGI